MSIIYCPKCGAYIRLDSAPPATPTTTICSDGPVHNFQPFVEPQSMPGPSIDKYCVIYLWHDMHTHGMFHYKEDCVTLKQLYHWICGTLRVLPNKVRVYFLSNLSNMEGRVRIIDDVTLRTMLQLVESSNNLESGIVVSIDNQSPITSPIVDNTVVSSLSSKSNKSRGSSSSRGTMQENFRDRVLNRDSRMCVFCGEVQQETLVAAHLLPVSLCASESGSSSTVLQQHGILDIYDTNNGISLCKDCYRAFDSNLCCVDVIHDVHDGFKYKLLVSEALMSHKSNGEKWTALNGRDVIVPTFPLNLSYWPREATFLYRQLLFEEKRKQRNQSAAEKPYVCLHCGLRTKTESGLNQHMQSKRCLLAQTSTRTSYASLHTPELEKSSRYVVPPSSVKKDRRRHQLDRKVHDSNRKLVLSTSPESIGK